jgi:hypothetical protein
MLQREWGTLKLKREGRGILPGTVNKQAGPGQRGQEQGARAQQQGAGKLVRVAEGGKLHRKGRKTHFPREL